MNLEVLATFAIILAIQLKAWYIEIVSAMHFNILFNLALVAKTQIKGHHLVDCTTAKTSESSTSDLSGTPCFSFPGSFQLLSRVD